MLVDLALVNATVATMVGDGYGLVTDASIGIVDGRIEFVGQSRPAADTTVDVGGRLVTPGLVDPHTHLVFGGNRATEFESRLGGATYAELNEAGGGIRSTVAATRFSSTDELARSAALRLGWLVGNGATTVEVKTGYGLDLQTEVRMLDAIDRLRGGDADLHVTLMAAHTVPEEFADDREGYIRLLVDEVIPAAVGRADSIDVFVETIGFSADEAERILSAGRAAGLGVAVHADQLTLGEGCHLAARYGARSADHLEHADEAAVAALAEGGVVPVLIPGASSFLDEAARPPIDLFRSHGLPMAVATDLNPGTSPTASLPLAMHLACVRFGLTPLEALRGATTAAAAALGLDDRGRLAEGLRADVAIWDVEHPAELSYWVGAPLCATTVVGGSLTKDLR
ncbi:MAG: imidazolonepropionase [Acidimicrobiia bacterium]|nr:imidazolonepropionase [Acidimicrobiia bacterium]